MKGAVQDQRTAVRRNRILNATATVLMLAGIVLAVLRPPWLTEPLQAAVQNAGVAAPLVFIALCMVTAPFHLSGVLVALSSVLWPLPVALLLSFTGTLLGCLLTVALLVRAGGVSSRQGEAWPAWLRRLSTGVTRRPVLIGLAARVALGSGWVLEAFYLLTGYTRRQYLLVTVVGVAIWVTQALVGVTLLHAALGVSPVLAVVAAVGLPVLIVPMIAVARRRRPRT